ncbi:polysaccharide pyruvyl transferase family protein [Candidatus Fermentibacteria bacterium]|nr:polysaccharide pyruvyl transferase family protein [Candidatus Fermentibacteria bacterium]
MNRTQRNPSTPRVLLVGYNGANNTGAEALLLSDIEDVRAVFGPGVSITVPTMNPANLRRYLPEGPGLSIVPMSPVFIRPVRRLVAEHDLVMLVEGSTYMDTWTTALLWCFLWATWCATSRGTACLAYAVDAGELSRLNRWLVRRVAGTTDQIIVRSEAAARRLRSWGVGAPLEFTADNAFNFAPRPADIDLLNRVWPDRPPCVVGIAPVDFTLWPVVARLWGRKQYCYRWPYYFSHSRERTDAAQGFAQTLAAFADWVMEHHDAGVAMLCMEQLDEPLAQRIHDLLRRRERAMVFSSREFDASQMTSVLRSLDYLITSRFHASVLSLEAAVPQIAVGHDLRLRTLYTDFGIVDELFLDAHEADLELLKERFALLRKKGDFLRRRLAEGHADHSRRAAKNRFLLAEFARSRGWKVASA